MLHHREVTARYQVSDEERERQFQLGMDNIAAERLLLKRDAYYRNLYATRREAYWFGFLAGAAAHPAHRVPELPKP